MTQRWETYLFQPTQWFPRLAKYDDLRGWETSVYLGPAEFFNNFGSFDVTLDVPEGWITTATGTLANAEDVLTDRTLERLASVLETDEEVWIVSDEEIGTGLLPGREGRQRWRYVAELVNDFAWATSDRFLWRALRAKIPGRGPIPIHMVHVPERGRLFDRAGAISRHALEFYSDLWAPYPFPQLTMQDGPSAGMEYPMVINSNAGAADHEVAHQWWPMMLGTNETRYGWMDEGLNTYMNILSEAHASGRPADLDGRGQSYGAWSGNEDEPPMMWTANYGGPLYGFQTYVKAPMMLSMLGGIVGDEAVQDAIRGYTAAWAFKHPSPWDFAFFVENALGRDLGWFWNAWLFTTESVEGSLQGVEEAEAGCVVAVHQAGEMPSPVVLRVELVEGAELGDVEGASVVREDDGAYEVRWPVEVWFDGRRTFEAALPCARGELVSVTFDPHGRFPDSDASDNVWTP